jgi:hypothetical protein
MNQSPKELGVDAIYEMRSSTDAARRIVKIFTTVYPMRMKEGDSGLLSKDWYVLGLNLGIIFHNIANKNVS